MTHDHTGQVLRHLIGMQTVTSEEEAAGNPIQPVYADLLALDRSEKAGDPKSIIDGHVNRINGALGGLKISKPDAVPGFQPDFREVKNRAVMDFAGCYEAPYLLQNPNAPGPEVEDDLLCLDLARKEISKEIGQGRVSGVLGYYWTDVLKTIGVKYITGNDFDVYSSILKESWNPDSNRDMMARMWMLGLIDMPGMFSGNFAGNDKKIKEIAGSIPLDPGTRRVFLPEEDGVKVPSLEYMKDPPDKIIGRDIGKIMIKSLIAWESDEDVDKSAVQKIEVNLIKKHGSKFPPRVIESLSASDFPATRTALACMPGLSSETAVELSRDTPAVQSALAKCTKDCSVLESMRSNPDLTAPTLKAVKDRLSKACR